MMKYNQYIAQVLVDKNKKRVQSLTRPTQGGVVVHAPINCFENPKVISWVDDDSPLPASCRKSRYFKALNVSNWSASSEPNKQQTNRSCVQKSVDRKHHFLLPETSKHHQEDNLQVEEHNCDKIRLQEYSNPGHVIQTNPREVGTNPRAKLRSYRHPITIFLFRTVS